MLGVRRVLRQFGKDARVISQAAQRDGDGCEGRFYLANPVDRREELLRMLSTTTGDKFGMNGSFAANAIDDGRRQPGQHGKHGESLIGVRKGSEGRSHRR